MPANTLSLDRPQPNCCHPELGSGSIGFSRLNKKNVPPSYAKERSALPAPHANKLRPAAFTVRFAVRHSPPLFHCLWTARSQTAVTLNSVQGASAFHSRTKRMLLPSTQPSRNEWRTHLFYTHLEKYSQSTLSFDIQQKPLRRHRSTDLLLDNANK